MGRIQVEVRVYRSVEELPEVLEPGRYVIAGHVVEIREPASREEIAYQPHVQRAAQGADSLASPTLHRHVSLLVPLLPRGESRPCNAARVTVQLFSPAFSRVVLSLARRLAVFSLASFLPFSV